MSFPKVKHDEGNIMVDDLWLIPDLVKQNHLQIDQNKSSTHTDSFTMCNVSGLG